MDVHELMRACPNNDTKQNGDEVIISNIFKLIIYIIIIIYIIKYFILQFLTEDGIERK